jgi:putative transposase
MTRLRRIEELDRIFFVTFNIERGVQSLAAAERDLVLKSLDELRGRHDFRLFGYVVMPDHVHLLLWPRSVSLVRILRDLKSTTGFALSRSRRVPGQLWQRSYFDFICRRARDFGAKLEYIHRNPVAAGCVANCEDWRWSSYRYYAKLGEPPIELDFIEFSGDPNELLWPAPWRPL